jgi:hypothetical protein
MKDLKRYVVTMDMYVYAENDYMARKHAHEAKDLINSDGDSRADVTEIGEQPFGSVKYTPLTDITDTK